MEAYFDNAATTKPFPEIADILHDMMLSVYANPSALHKKGMQARKLIEESAPKVLRFLNLNDDYDVIFTSGATESTNLAIKGTLERFQHPETCHIISTPIEHPCVKNVCEEYRQKGTDVTYLHVDSDGRIDLEYLLSSIKDNTKLISIIWVNNEIGTVQDLDAILRAIRNKKSDVVIHIDAVQACGKTYADLANADLISISGHKFHGPKGIGVLIKRKSVMLHPQLLGGGQQNGLRSGTMNPPLIFAFGKTCELYAKTNPGKYLSDLQQYLYQNLKTLFGNEIFNTRPERGYYAPHIMNLSFEGLKGEVIVHMLEEQGIYLSTSSACSSHNKTKKSILSELGYTKKRIDGTIRISLSIFNTYEEVDYLINSLKIVVDRLNSLHLKG